MIPFILEFLLLTMLKNLFSNQSKTITGAAVILGIASLISRVIGILRDRTLAHIFGAGDALDAYFAAFRIPDFIYAIVIIGALSAGFIPVFTKVLTNNKKEAWQLTNNIINIFGFFLIISCTLIFILAHKIVPLIVPGFDGEKLKLSVTLTRIMILSPLFLGLSTIISGVLQSFKNFLISSLAPLLYNLSIIASAFFLTPYLGITGLAWGVACGAFLHLIVQLPSIYQHGYRYQKIANYKDENTKKIFKLMIPRTLALATSQVNWLILTIFASTLGSGSITAFTFADNLQYAPIGIVGVSFAMAAFPILSLYVAEQKKEELIRHLNITMRQILLMIIPVTIIFLILRAQVIRIVLGTGKFNWEDTILTMNSLAMFSLSLFAQSLAPLLTRTLFTLQDTWSPFIAGLTTAVINTLLGFLLKDKFGISGLALAFSISAIINFILLFLILRHKLGSLGEKNILKSIFKITVAGLIMALTIQLLKVPLSKIVDMQKFWGVFIQFSLSAISGIFIYILICYILKLEEISQIKQSLSKKWLKIKSSQTDIEKTV